MREATLMEIIMRFITVLALSTAALNLIACGGPDGVTPEQAAKQAEVTLETTKVDIAAIASMSPIELMENATVQSHQLADVLANVKDEASAEIAIAKMRALGPQLKAVGDRLDSLDENDLKLSIKTMKSMGKFAEAQMRIFKETGRIATDHPELREIITDGFEEIEIDFQ